MYGTENYDSDEVSEECEAGWPGWKGPAEGFGAGFEDNPFVGFPCKEGEEEGEESEENQSPFYPSPAFPGSDIGANHGTVGTN